MTPTRNDQPATRAVAPITAKRPYATPCLIVHGTVAELTASKLVGPRGLAPGYLTEA